MSDQTQIITGEQNIQNARLLAQRRALELEVYCNLKGRMSMLRFVKQGYKFKGDNEAVFHQFAELVTTITGVSYVPSPTARQKIADRDKKAREAERQSERRFEQRAEDHLAGFEG